MFERFTEQARESVVGATQVAQAHKSPRIGREHLLIGLALASEPTLARAGITAESLTTALADLGEPGQESRDAAALMAIGIDVDDVRALVGQNFGPDAWEAAAPDRRRDRGLAGRILGDHRPFTAGAKKTLELALREAVADKSRELTSTHCLRGLLRDPGDVVTALLGPATLTELRDQTRRPAA